MSTLNIMAKDGLKPFDGKKLKELTLHLFQELPEYIKDYQADIIRLVNCGDVHNIWKNKFMKKIIINSCPGVYIPKMICDLPALTELESIHTRYFNFENLELSNIVKIDIDGAHQLDRFPDKQFEKILIKDTKVTCPFPAPVIEFDAQNCNGLYNIPSCTRLRVERCNFTAPLDMNILNGTTHVKFNECFYKVSELEKRPLIAEFKEIPCSVRDLELIKCGLTSLPASIGNAANLRHLDITDNAITKLPIEITRLRLDIFQYNGNTISNIQNPMIQRWLRRANQGKSGKLTYEDTQNVHNNEIQESVRESIRKIMGEYAGEIIDYQHDKDIPNDIKPIINNLVETTTGYYMDITYANLLNAVLSIVNKCNDAKDIKQHSLKSQVLDSVNVCMTGRISRLVSVLAGRREDLVQITISEATQMQNIMTMLARNARNNVEIDVLSAEAKTKFLADLRKEYDERKFNADDIDASMEFADSFWDDMYGSPDGAEEERKEEEATNAAIRAVAE